MKSVEWHKKAMGIIDKADLLAFEGEIQDAEKLYRKALTLEKKSAAAAKDEKIGEPSVSILFRSAASIALKVKDFEEAKKLAKEGLTNTTPREIVKELRAILKEVSMLQPGQVMPDLPKPLPKEIARSDKASTSNRTAATRKLSREPKNTAVPYHEFKTEFFMIRQFFYESGKYSALQLPVDPNRPKIEIQVQRTTDLGKDLSSLVFQEITYNLSYNQVKEQLNLPSTGKYCDLIHVYCQPSFLESFLRIFPGLGPYLQNVKSGKSDQLYEKSQSISTAINESLRNLLLAISKGSPFNILLDSVARELFALTLIDAFGDINPFYRAADIKKARNVSRQLLDNPRHTYSTNELARIANLPTGLVKDIFTEIYGMNPARYMLHIRMEKAKLLLEATDLAIVEIATQTGFNSPSTFHRNFKRFFNESPLVLRTSFIQKKKLLLKNESPLA